MTEPGAAPRLDRRWLLALALLVVCLRLPAACSAPVISVDESSYVLLARAAPHHPSVLLAHAYHPLYPAALIPAVAVGGETGGRLLSVALALLAAWCVFGLTRERFGERAALGAALLFACLPGPVEGGARLLSEAVYVPALLGSVWGLLVAVRTGSLAAAAIAGACSGAAYLARMEGLAPAVAGTAGLACLAVWHRGAPPVAPGRRLGQAATTAGSCALLALPYMAAIGGLSRKKQIGALDAAFHHAGGDPVLQSIIPSWIGTADVGSAERAPVREFLHEWVSGASPLLVALMLAGGLIVAIRRWRPRAADGALAAVILLYVLAHIWLLMAARYLSSRHVWPVALLALPWAGRVLQWLRDWAPARRPRAGLLATGLVVLLALASGATAAAWPWRAGRSYLREAGVALRPLLQPGDGVAAADMRVPYYAGARPFVIGRTTLAQLRERSRSEGVRFLAARMAVLEARVEGWKAQPPDWASLEAEYPILSRSGRTRGTFAVFRLSP